MPPDTPTVLAFDTSAAHCAAALLSGGRIVAKAHEDMARGQAERLMPLLDRVLASGGAAWSDLTCIGVGIGPGNFTGIRIAVSAARGLSLGLGIPAVGVSLFDTTRALGGRERVAVPAPRGQAYVRDFGSAGPAALLPVLPQDPVAVSSDHSVADHVARIARIAAEREARPGERPAPLYIRPADAAPSSQPAPVILP